MKMDRLDVGREEGERERERAVSIHYSQRDSDQTAGNARMDQNMDDNRCDHCMTTLFRSL